MTEEKLMPPAANEADARSDIIQVDSIHQFVHHLNGWHSTRVAEMRHMITMPEGVSMVIEEDGVQKTVLMEGAMLAGFKAGVELALMRLGTLPFSVELEDGTTH